MNTTELQRATELVRQAWGAAGLVRNSWDSEGADEATQEGAVACIEATLDTAYEALHKLCEDEGIA